MATSDKLYGAILGDLAGQPYEFNYSGDFSEFNIHDEKSTFTDDTIMTLATAEAILNHPDNYPSSSDFEKVYKRFGRTYDGDYYGSRFEEWIYDLDGKIGDSWGNGAIMRVSPCYYAKESKRNQLILALNSAFTSHFNRDVYESIIKHQYYFHNIDLYDYDREITGDFPIQTFTKFDSKAVTSVIFLGDLIRACKSTHEAIEKAIKARGDTDTNASIAGEVFSNYRNDLTKADIDYVESKLDKNMLYILREFNNKFNK